VVEELCGGRPHAHQPHGSSLRTDPLNERMARIMGHLSAMCQAAEAIMMRAGLWKTAKDTADSAKKAKQDAQCAADAADAAEKSAQAEQPSFLFRLFASSDICAGLKNCRRQPRIYRQRPWLQASLPRRWTGRIVRFNPRSWSSLALCSLLVQSTYHGPSGKWRRNVQHVRQRQNVRQRQHVCG
jgi:hypothetical protein